MLEIGPGSEPFPVSPDADVVYVDKRVGGRDETWPELVGTPRGPETDVDLDVDRDGLAEFADASFDVAIASHVVEHLADPVRLIVELGRVVRTGGVVVLVVPDRRQTFDRLRASTPARHVLDEHAAGVDEVSDDHIRDFCESIWRQPAFHPEPVRSWHDPAGLDDERLDLHRRRSIHVHCWTADEFVSLLAAMDVEGLASFRLRNAWVCEDPDSRDDEFGLVLEQVAETDGTGSSVVEPWCDLVLASPHRDAGRLVDLGSALDRDLGGGEDSAASLPRRHLQAVLAALRADRHRAAELRAELDRVLSSPSHRIGRGITTPARLLRDRGRST